MSSTTELRTRCNAMLKQVSVTLRLYAKSSAHTDMLQTAPKCSLGRMTRRDEGGGRGGGARMRRHAGIAAHA